MHEWALAEAVVSSTTVAAEKEGLERVVTVNIKIGELQQIDLEIFKFALSQLFSAKYKNVKIKITRTRATLKCKACGHQWLFNKIGLDEHVREAIHFVPEVAHSFIRCPVCTSPDFDVIQGRGVLIENIIGEKSYDRSSNSDNPGTP